MSGSRPKHSNNSLYPGASQQLGRKKQIDIEHKSKFNNESTYSQVGGQKDSYARKIQDAELNLSFDLAWVEHNSQRNASYKPKKIEHLLDHGYESHDRTLRKDRESINKFFRQQDIFESKHKMQSDYTMKQGSEINPSHPNTALDISDDLLNQPSTSASLIDDPSLAGQLTDGSPEIKQSLSDDYNQLDEPILDTLVRDLLGIYNKTKIIALPLSSYEIYKIVLRGWDLWGPLMLCTFLAFNLHHSDNIGPHFADIFVLVWFGSCMISLNYRLLSLSSGDNRVTTSQQSNQFEDVKSGDTTNLKENLDELGDRAALTIEGADKAPFQTLMSPPSIFQLMCVFGYCLVAPCFGLLLLKIFSFKRLFFERIIIGLLFGFAWPTVCSIRILIRYQHPEKRSLAIYPIGLFYFVLSCLIILNH